MPTYYACGSVYDSDPPDDNRYLDYPCESCDACAEEYVSDEYDSDESGLDHRAASYAAERVALTLDEDLPDMQVPQIRRAVSCEWEGSSGVRTAYRACNEVGGADIEFHEDGTCDGEVVFGYLRLWDRENAREYGRSVAVIDHLRTAGEVRVGFNAGHHIHVAARTHDTYRGLSPNSLVSLYSIFAHCEDLLYRLASAGWSKHRTEGGGSYSAPMFKLDPYQARTAKNVGNLLGQDRYQGLNVTPYLQAIQGCRCGAYRFGEWQSCECNDHRMTVEWRLWNAAVSPRKIRAYVAISAVLTEYASQVDVRDVNKLTENPFHFQGTGYVDEDSLVSQLDYLTTRPGFTARDRKDLYWLASISPGMGELGREYEASRGNTYSDEQPSPIVA